MAMRIPIYSDMSPKRRQMTHMIVGGLVMMGVVLGVSGFLEGPSSVKPVSLKDGPPKPKALGAVTGAELEPKDVWMGNAGRELAVLREELKAAQERDRTREAEQERVNRELTEQLRTLRDGRNAGPSFGVTAPAASSPVAAAAASAAQAALLGTQAQNSASLGGAGPGRQSTQGTQGIPSAMTLPPFPRQPRARPTDVASGPTTYPPGSPMSSGPGTALGPTAEGAIAKPATPPVLMRVSIHGAGASDADAATGTQPRAVAGAGAGTGSATRTNAPPRRSVDSFLPVGFTKAVILGGLAAPTGGQSQSNPVPVLLRLEDAAVLPNRFRAAVRDCFVVGEGYGDQSAERAYIRSTLLSCVMLDGTVLEVPLKGSVFGEDGMNGVRGTLVTKQGAILTNALLSGIASGIGQGIATASTTVSTTAVGTTTTGPTDTTGILRAGIGTGVGKALDRLSQYYISLAERTFPVIEVQAGRTVDLIVTQGVQLDVPLQAGVSLPGAGRSDDRTQLVREVVGQAVE